MTESLRYLSYSREASPIGPPAGRGLLYGPLGTQLERGSLFLMGKLRFTLFCPTHAVRGIQNIHVAVNNDLQRQYIVE